MFSILQDYLKCFQQLFLKEKYRIFIIFMVRFPGQYGTQDHQLWMIYFIIPGLIIINFIIPLLILLLLMINKNRLDKIKIRRHISYLLNEYRIEKFYWEQIKLLKKAIFIFILTNFETEVVLNASLLGLSLLIYQKLATFHQPFINQKLNNLVLQSSQICSISILLALIKQICEQNDYFGSSIMIQFFIIACFIKMCCPFIFDFARNYKKFYKYLFIQINFCIRKYQISFLQFCQKIFWIKKNREIESIIYL
ncbi:unnamed protein product (macronuclear) [Paramecium tetraurelia]|uniref:Transmembrane protein n=1 Tax=Paramecium tetraurelia TaxID=5888 RepID=A0EFN2_PARTE|nr:uncharacterized protein GSPATT00026446001 [Paramecium tetraurelia]CAK94123.1 unnamed protein product [Paramecium tetraurelia]|eukprot:XP_001461496.1 hypothetical protein (macronuclear) [Paramecium tetraurelia strain d4-2]